MLPTISVIMPAYNCENHIAASIESILNQTFVDFEFIIIDDASTDDTYQIIKGYIDPRIRLFRNEQNLGIVCCLNEYFPKAKGKYIARMDADDVSLLNRLQQQVEFMDANPKIGVLGTWVTYINAEGLGFIEEYPIVHEQHKLFLLDYPSVVHPTMVFRRSLLNDLELIYDPKWLYVEEYELLIRLANLTKLHNLPKRLLQVRIWGNSTSKKYRQKQLEKVFQLRKVQYESLIERPLNFKEEAFISEKFTIQYFNLFPIKSFCNEILKNNLSKLIFNNRLLKQFINEKILICLRQNKRFQLAYMISLLSIVFLFPLVFIQLSQITLNKFKRLWN